MNIDLDDIDLDLVAQVPILWIPASRFAFEPSRTTVLAMLDTRNRTRHTILDLDWRPCSGIRRRQPRISSQPSSTW